MIKPVYFNDVMKAVVAATSVAILPTLQAVNPGITGIRFEYGHHTDINIRLGVAEQGGVSPYPVIAMFEDYRVRKGGQEGLWGVADLKLIILYLTKSEETREWREVNVFRPILIPIYLELLRQLRLSGNFQIWDETTIRHDQINRPHWGDPALYGNDGYLFNQVLDGIELSNLQLETYLQLC